MIDSKMYCHWDMEYLPFHSKAGTFLFQVLCPSVLKPCFPVPNYFVAMQTFVLTEGQMVCALPRLSHTLPTIVPNLLPQKLA